MLKKLIPGVLALAMFASVNANTDVETKETEKTVVEFVAAAQALGFSNEEVKAAFVTALENADANGVVTLSLTNEQKKTALIVAGVTVAAVVVGVGIWKRDGKVPFAKLWRKAPAPAPTEEDGHEHEEEA
jgi:hypothetical protein